MFRVRSFVDAGLERYSMNVLVFFFAASKPLWASSRLEDRVGKLQYLKKGTIVVTSRRKRCLGAEKSDAS